MAFDSDFHPHRRYNPLTKEYVLVSPHRNKRPWLGQTEQPPSESLLEYDPKCYLCPGNSRSGGQMNEVYAHTLVFENDFPALLSASCPEVPVAPHPLLNATPVNGACDVVIFHRRHDLTLARLSLEDIRRVIEEWCSIYSKRGSQENVKYVQIFENKGAMMGCSNPHPHGQVWSLSQIPGVPRKELDSLLEYATSPQPLSDAPKDSEGRPNLLLEYANFEAKISVDGQGRTVFKNEHWLVVVPWWAVWPFEVLLLPYRRHIPSLMELDEGEKITLADALSRITKRYDNLFQTSFAYSMGIHQRPIPRVVDNRSDYDVAQVHFHFYPPLLRSATVKKFLVGFELMAEPQRDLTAETAASQLRQCPEEHYLDLNLNLKL